MTVEKKVDVIEFIQKGHTPNQLKKICMQLKEESKTDRLSFARDITGLNTMIEKKWQPPGTNLEELLELPKESIGHNLAIYLIGMNKDQSGKHSIPGWLRFRLDYNLDYGNILSTRVKQTHDFCHMLTNFNTTQMGEIAVQGFYLSQRVHMLSLMYIYDILGSYMRDEIDDSYIHAFVEGMELGMNAKEDIAFLRYEEMLDKNLDELRIELNLTIDNENKPWRNFLAKLDPDFK